MHTNEEVIVKGALTDNHTRCAHYHSPLDIIAIQFKCCNDYYACIHCHEETAGHEAARWNKDDYDTKAVLCGHCKSELTIKEYLSCNYFCPCCNSAFNPKCSLHNHYYFEAG